MEELYDNLYDFIKNFEILLTKNIFNGEFQQEIKTFGNELHKLCEQKHFNVDFSDILAMTSFVELLNHTPNKSQEYLTSSVEKFYSDIIEPTKFEIQ